MTEAEVLREAAERYRSKGFEVTLSPPDDLLPAELRNRGYPAVLARRNGKSVLVEVWQRGRVHDLAPSLLPVGWEFDAVVTPDAERSDLPDPGLAVTSGYANQLLGELENLLPRAAGQARFLLAWTAVESAARVAASRNDIPTEGLTARVLFRELADEGIISGEQWPLLDRAMTARNRITHGVPADDFDPTIADKLAGIARELLSNAIPVSAAP